MEYSKDLKVRINTRKVAIERLFAELKTLKLNQKAVILEKEDEYANFILYTQELETQLIANEKRDRQERIKHNLVILSIGENVNVTVQEFKKIFEVSDAKFTMTIEHTLPFGYSTVVENVVKKQLTFDDEKLSLVCCDTDESIYAMHYNFAETTIVYKDKWDKADVYIYEFLFHTSDKNMQDMTVLLEFC